MADSEESVVVTVSGLSGSVYAFRRKSGNVSGHGSRVVKTIVLSTSLLFSFSTLLSWGIVERYFFEGTIPI